MRGEVHQVTAINKRNYRYARWENSFVQLFHFRVDSGECFVGIRSFAQQHNSGNNVFVVDDLAISAMKRSCELTKPDLRPLIDDRDILHAQGCAGLGENDYVLDILDVPYQPDFAKIQLLKAGLDKAPARVRVVVCELLLHLSEA